MIDFSLNYYRGDMSEQFLKNFLKIFVICIITIVLVELISRFYLWNIASESQFQKYASLNQLQDRYGDLESSSIYIPHRYLGYYPNPSLKRDGRIHNALGFRGEEIEIPKPESTYRIVMIGGSTTYSQAEDNRDTYPYQLENILHEKEFTTVEVINAGVGSYTSLESIINLQARILSLDPDMVIIYHGINDIHPRLVWPPDAYQSDLSGARVHTSRRSPPRWQYSTILRIMAIELKMIRSHSNLDDNLIGRPSTFYGLEFRNQVINGSYPSGIFKTVSAQEMLETNKPIFFENNIRSMIAISKAYDIEPILITFAYSPNYDNNFPRVASPEYQFAFAEHNEVLKELATELDIELYDLEAVMPDDVKYYTDGRHFTPEGNRYRANLIAEFLIANDLIPKP